MKFEPEKSARELYIESVDVALNTLRKIVTEITVDSPKHIQAKHIEAVDVLNEKASWLLNFIRNKNAANQPSNANPD